MTTTEQKRAIRMSRQDGGIDTNSKFESSRATRAFQVGDLRYFPASENFIQYHSEKIQ